MIKAQASVALCLGLALSLTSLGALADCLPFWACFLMEEVLRVQQVLSDAENEMIKWSGLNRGNNLTDDNLKERVQDLQDENVLSSWEKREFQLSLLKLKEVKVQQQETWIQIRIKSFKMWLGGQEPQA